MTAHLALAVVLALGPMAVPETAYAGGSCASSATWRVPPSEIRVFRARLHRVDVVPFRLYVERVLAAGAFPAWLPLESIKAGAVAVAGYARSEMRRGHRTGARSGHRCFDIRDGGWGQHYLSDVRIHSKIRRAVDAVWGVLIRKHDRYIRPGWRGGAGHDGWHLYEQTASHLARHGWDWRRLLHYFYGPDMELVG